MAEKFQISQSQSPQDFNWNDINVDKKNTTHEMPLSAENFENTFENKENIGVNNDAKINCNHALNKAITPNQLLKMKVENVGTENNVSKLAVKMLNLNVNADVELAYPIKNEFKHEKIENITVDNVQATNDAAIASIISTAPTASATALSIKSELRKINNENNIYIAAAAATATATATAGAANSAPKSNIVLEWSLKNEQNNVNQNLITIPPQAFEYQKIYQLKKKEALRKIEEHERKQREFRSRPKPNFTEFHKRMYEQRKIHRITVPYTPEVLKHSQEMERKKIQKLETLKKQLQPPKIEPRPLTVLKEPPFVPKLRNNTAVQQIPFKLSLEQRLQERRKYNEAVRKYNEEKIKKLQNVVEEKKKREEEEVKQFRKMATFKARPNPFKRE